MNVVDSSGWLEYFGQYFSTARARRSVEPPGAIGTMPVTGFCVSFTKASRASRIGENQVPL